MIGHGAIVIIDQQHVSSPPLGQIKIVPSVAIDIGRTHTRVLERRIEIEELGIKPIICDHAHFVEREIIDEIVTGIPANSTVFVERECDRSAAIRRAIAVARLGDIVLIAGKGHEDYQIIGKEKRPFDDRLEARVALNELCASVSKQNKKSVDDVSANVSTQNLTAGIGARS